VIKLKRKSTSPGFQMFESCVTTKHTQKLQHHKLKPANVSNLSFLKENVHFKNTSEYRIFVHLLHSHLCHPCSPEAVKQEMAQWCPKSPTRT
jgi:hypothetical protein